MNTGDKDYIIVGSGPGGATVARDLSFRKRKVLILEWGDNDPLTGRFWWGARSLLWPGKSLLVTRQMLGLVRGNTVRARHVGRDIMAGLRHLVGGEIHEYAKLLAESREQALDRMTAEAEQLGANAIANVRFSTSVIMGGAAEIMAYGTALVIKARTPGS